MQFKLITRELLKQLNLSESLQFSVSECEPWDFLSNVFKLLLALVPGTLALSKKTICQFNSSLDNLTLKTT